MADELVKKLKYLDEKTKNKYLSTKTMKDTTEFLERIFAENRREWIKLIIKESGGSALKRDLQHKTGLDTSVLDAALEILEKEGQITHEEKRETGGRPGVIYRLVNQKGGKKQE